MTSDVSGPPAAKTKRNIGGEIQYFADYPYMTDSSVQGLTNGSWGLLRAYGLGGKNEPLPDLMSVGSWEALRDRAPVQVETHHPPQHGVGRHVDRRLEPGALERPGERRVLCGCHQDRPDPTSRFQEPAHDQRRLRHDDRRLDPQVDDVSQLTGQQRGGLGVDPVPRVGGGEGITRELEQDPAVGALRRRRPPASAHRSQTTPQMSRRASSSPWGSSRSARRSQTG